MMKRMVAKRIERYAYQERLIPNEQFGFRKKHSITAQLARLTDYITHGYNNNKHTGLVMLDVEKAYDTIWVRGILYKLINFKFPLYLIKFLQSHLTDRSFSVTISGFFLLKNLSRPDSHRVQYSHRFFSLCIQPTFLDSPIYN
jgi:hypothetical protein